MTVLLPVRPIFRAVVSTVVPEASQLHEQGWAELETLVETALQDRPAAMLRQLGHKPLETDLIAYLRSRAGGAA